MLRQSQPVRNAGNRRVDRRLEAWLRLRRRWRNGACLQVSGCPACRLPPRRERMGFCREIPRAGFDESNCRLERLGVRAADFAPVFEDLRRAPKADFRERSACVIGSLIVSRSRPLFSVMLCASSMCSWAASFFGVWLSGEADLGIEAGFPLTATGGVTGVWW